MASVRIIPQSGITSEETVVPASPAESLLNALLKAGQPLRHDCGGKALCGTCRIRILYGEQGLSPKLPREQERLSAVRAGEDERLACQVHAVRDAGIQPVLPLRKGR